MEHLLKGLTDEQIEKIMIEYDSSYVTDDISLLKKGQILINDYLKANENERKVIDDLIINLCGWSLKTLVSKVI